MVRWSCREATAQDWVGTTVEFKLEPKGQDQTQVRFAHRGYPEPSDFAAHCNSSWGRYLESLRLVCEYGQGLPWKPEKSDPVSESARVTSIGGVFFRTNDPKATATWYADHLGLKQNPYGSTFEFREGSDPSRTGYLIWEPDGREHGIFR